MYDLSNLSPVKGAVKKKKRVARGPGSGLGKTAGRGEKGQKSRSGGAKPRFFEGGQMPLYRRLPKRGFKNIWKVQYEIVNLRDIEERFSDGEVVNPKTLKEKNLVKGKGPVKILGDGNLTKKVTFEGVVFSKKAQEKIGNPGGNTDAEKSE